MLRIDVYDERLFPNDALQIRYYNLLSLMKEWQLVGVYTNDNSSDKNKNGFRKLLKLFERRKIDIILCSSLEESRIIDNEVG